MFCGDVHIPQEQLTLEQRTPERLKLTLIPLGIVSLVYVVGPNPCSHQQDYMGAAAVLISYVVNQAE